jgi:hypothetical protein
MDGGFIGLKGSTVQNAITIWWFQKKPGRGVPCPVSAIAM